MAKEKDYRDQIDRSVNNTVRAGEIAIAHHIRIVASIKTRRILAKPVVPVHRIGKVRIRADVADTARHRGYAGIDNLRADIVEVVGIGVAGSARVVPHDAVSSMDVVDAATLAGCRIRHHRAIDEARRHA